MLRALANAFAVVCNIHHTTQEDLRLRSLHWTDGDKAAFLQGLQSSEEPRGYRGVQEALKQAQRSMPAQRLQSALDKSASRLLAEALEQRAQMEAEHRSCMQELQALAKAQEAEIKSLRAARTRHNSVLCEEVWRLQDSLKEAKAEAARAQECLDGLRVERAAMLARVTTLLEELGTKDKRLATAGRVVEMLAGRFLEDSEGCTGARCAGFRCKAAAMLERLGPSLQQGGGPSPPTVTVQQ